MKHYVLCVLSWFIVTVDTSSVSSCFLTTSYAMYVQESHLQCAPSFNTKYSFKKISSLFAKVLVYGMVFGAFKYAKKDVYVQSRKIMS